MDEEALLSKTIITEEPNRPAIRREFPSGYLDLSPSWRRQSTAHLITTDAIIPIITTPNSSSLANILADINNKRRLTRRSHSAPSVFTYSKEAFHDSLDPRPAPKSTPLIVRQAFIGVVLYVMAGIAIYLIKSGSFKGEATFKPVDALYFSVVTLCTIGYGDIVPDTTFTKLYTCIFILVGFGFIDILLNGLVTYVLDRQEAVLLSTLDANRFNAMFRTYMVDTEKGRMRIRMKVALALAVVIVCIAVGTVVAHFLEEMSWVDSLYLSVTSVTTVSTFAVARAFLYLTELRIDKRNRTIAKWVLQRKMTLGDLVAADLDNDGSISKSEYIIYKLKEMGKIAEKDIHLICNQFDNLDNSNCGKITMADLMENDDSA
ncbi:hypothetical protein L1049_023814 [Liquidambar formosana]|uniref:Potassium channel domain-containing protein n=1 Tax=Liquidambar formosana TaxID=63359 RepID=A0AAP0RV18_LIQFO